MPKITIKKRKMVCKAKGCARLLPIPDPKDDDMAISSLSQVGERLAEMMCAKHKAIINKSFGEMAIALTPDKRGEIEAKLIVPEPFSDERKKRAN